MLTVRKVFKTEPSGISAIEIMCNAATDGRIEHTCIGKCKECKHCDIVMHELNKLTKRTLQWSDILSEKISNILEELSRRLVFEYKFCDEHRSMYFKFNQIEKELGYYKVFNNMVSDQESTRKYIDLKRRYDLLVRKYVDAHLDLGKEENCIYCKIGYRDEYLLLHHDVSALFVHVLEKLNSLTKEKEKNGYK